MKRSKIFLGITTGVLAVVAFTAAKTNKFSASLRQGFYTNPSGLHRCTVGSGFIYSTKNETGTLNQAIDENNLETLYSYNANGFCQKPLFTAITD